MKLSLVVLVASLSSVVLGCNASSPSPRVISAPAAVPRGSTRPPPVVDRHAQAERDAAEIFRAMQDDLLACFTRAMLLPDATAHVVVDVLVAPDGTVRDVTTTGGARAGPGAMRCMERRIARATFAPPYAGGTSRIQVPFAFSFEP